MTVRIEEVPVDDARAVGLRGMLDDELTVRYGPVTSGEDPELTAARREALRVRPDDVIATFLALDDDGTPLGHVMLRRLGVDVELKRLIVPAVARRRGVGRALTTAVIERARAEGARRVILQTGKPQPESIALYTAAGFTPIPVYEPYVASMPTSLCFELPLVAPGDRAGLRDRPDTDRRSPPSSLL
ncbi:GNAT family N-acetyltransferase [Microbacterium sp. zg.Y1090]|uniref:GNAT family N-acetyltransferase n=1 Tax=Microbacterium wangruii TaxID=3049073 RepID=UPI00214D9CF1|nr:MULTISPECIES: GNAT family N-acetyltransferase [unclassified Microbacterium]MCR2819623.1 GNAT family N-acetyltransferase [Microbacterium sp. zg.Y1090]MDL5487471.1 GNAT family N-acetyltransferase [Microbacterium sp. zg-Y1211]WIM28131.1 GNAT family N-acetyltransferase [Microbacterium sp. zg-Y1090]